MGETGSAKKLLKSFTKAGAAKERDRYSERTEIGESDTRDNGGVAKRLHESYPLEIVVRPMNSLNLTRLLTFQYEKGPIRTEKAGGAGSRWRGSGPKRLRTKLNPSTKRRTKKKDPSIERSESETRPNLGEPPLSKETAEGTETTTQKSQRQLGRCVLGMKIGKKKPIIVALRERTRKKIITWRRQRSSKAKRRPEQPAAMLGKVKKAFGCLNQGPTCSDDGTTTKTWKGTGESDRVSWGKPLKWPRGRGGGGGETYPETSKKSKGLGLWESNDVQCNWSTRSEGGCFRMCLLDSLLEIR